MKNEFKKAIGPEIVPKESLVKVIAYTSEPIWLEVIEDKGEFIVCHNFTGEEFSIPRYDIYEVTNDSSVLF